MSTALVPVGSLVEEINAEHEACVNSVRNGLEHAIKCGNLLRTVRVDMPHGDWYKWLEANFAASRQTADSYIQVADANFQNPDLMQKTDGTLRAAISYIGRQAGGRDLALKPPQESEQSEPVKTYALTLAQLTSLACRRWHRPPTEKEVFGWLKDSQIV